MRETRSPSLHLDLVRCHNSGSNLILSTSVSRSPAVQKTTVSHFEARPGKGCRVPSGRLEGARQLVTFVTGTSAAGAGTLLRAEKPKRFAGIIRLVLFEFFTTELSCRFGLRTPLGGPPTAVRPLGAQAAAQGLPAGVVHSGCRAKCRTGKFGEGGEARQPQEPDHAAEYEVSSFSVHQNSFPSTPSSAPSLPSQRSKK